MCVGVRGGQFIANNTKRSLRLRSLKKKKQPVMSSLRVERKMGSEEEGRFNLGHQSPVKFECNRAQNGLLSKESLRGADGMSAGFPWTLKLQPQFCIYKKVCIFLEGESIGFVRFYKDP